MLHPRTSLLNHQSLVPRQSTLRHARTSLTAILIAGCCGLLLTHHAHAQPPDTAAQTTQVDDAWYVIHFDGQPAGYERVRTVRSHSSAAASRHSTDPDLQIRSQPGDTDTSQPETVQRIRDTHLQLKRLGNDLSVTAFLSTTETVDGQLINFELQRQDAEGKSIERNGHWDERLQLFSIEEKVQASRRRYSLAAPRSVRSPIFSGWIPGSVDAELRRDTWAVLFPETTAVANITVQFEGRRSISTDSGKDLTTDMISYYPANTPSQKTKIYIDRDNVVQLQQKDILGGQLRLQRTTAETALATIKGRSLDLDINGIVPINRVPRLSASQQQLTLELHTPGVPGFQVPDGTFQQVQRIDGHTHRITLLKPVRNRTASAGLQSLTRKPVAATRWMPTDDPVVQQLAKSGAVGESDSLQICLRLERYLHSEIKRSAFSTTLLPADRIARQLRGDCTEHAVLLATLIRVHGIRTRIVSGLVMLQQGIGFTGHTWVEALIDEQWVPFDSTVRSTELGLTHIRLADSELPDSVTSGIQLFIPILDLTGQADISVIQSN
jgi:hypothetical protein